MNEEREKKAKNANSLTPLKMSSTNKVLFMLLLVRWCVLLTRIICSLIIDSIHIKIFDTSMLEIVESSLGYLLSSFLNTKFTTSKNQFDMCEYGQMSMNVS